VLGIVVHVRQRVHDLGKQRDRAEHHGQRDDEERSEPAERLGF
jgi:hypothetical protein